MERQTGSHEETELDPTQEWTDPGTETGLEEPMWPLGLGGSGGGGVSSYPERPDEADCIHYLRTGFCGYGSRCRFNHPPDRRSVIGAARASAVEYPERVGQPVCQYYMRTGTCKFGMSCKFHHPKQGAGSAAPVALNYLGYPLRPGERECSYYLKTGQCKFGASCKFHHPQSAGIQVATPAPPPQAAPVPPAVVAPTVYSPVQSPSVHSSQQYGLVVTRPPLFPSYVQGPYGPMLLSPGMVPYPGWTPYQATVSPVASPSTQPSTGSSSLYGVAQFSSMPPVPGPYHVSLSTVGASSSSQKEKSFPERPGQPECQYYIKTGECRFGSSCKYHHPPDLFARETNVDLSPVGLPLRPGAAPCSHYAQHGVCKFGRACKFDHRIGALSYSPSASSLADMPVAPYPVGLSAPTLAPSSSSSDLQPEPISGSSLISTRITSSVSTSSASIGSILSKGESVPQKSSQSSGPSVGTDSGRNTEEQSSS